MKRINLYLSLYSLVVLLVTAERFSFTTKIILQPYSFLRLHEVVQMSVLILASAIIPFFVLRELTNKFEDLRKPKGMLLATVFVTGIYFYATGNGLHEVSSYLFNTYCNVKQVEGGACGSMFYNDYYFGNILYFIGAALMTIPLILFERQRPMKNGTKKDMVILFANSFVFMLGLFAYAAFDRVLVGVTYTAIMMVITGILLLSAKMPFQFLPYTTYATLAYTVATIASVIVRFS